MSGEIKKIDEMLLSGTENGQITVSTIEKPYGKESEDVVSIGISLQASSEEPDWKVHIPKENIDAVIVALQKAKERL